MSGLVGSEVADVSGSGVGSPPELEELDEDELELDGVAGGSPGNGNLSPVLEAGAAFCVSGSPGNGNF